MPSPRALSLAVLLAAVGAPALAGPAFPLVLWWPAPLAKDVPNYPNEAAAMAAEHFTVAYGFSGVKGGLSPWPEQFGADAGELKAIKANGLFMVAAPHVPFTDNTLPNSVASVIALAHADGAEANVLGYAPEDEPACAVNKEKPINFAMIPDVARQFHAWDPTRAFFLSHVAWMMSAPRISDDCFRQAVAAIQATAVASEDNYVMAHVIHNPYAPSSDFLSVANDTLFIQDLNVQGLRQVARPGQPVWAYVEGGGDNLVSGDFNSFPAGVTNGSEILVNAYFAPWPWAEGRLATKFTDAWKGLTVSGAGIPPGTTVVRIIDETHLVMSNKAVTTACVPAELSVSMTAGSKLLTVTGGCADLTAPGYAFRPITGAGIPAGVKLVRPIDATHIPMSQPATRTGRTVVISAGQSERVTISGGARRWMSRETGDCVVARNLCVVQGNTYRATPAQVNAEVWMSLIAGADGIEYFCGDATTYMFCLGAGKDPAALAAQKNTAYVNETVLRYAPVLKSQTLGSCSMETLVDRTGKMTTAPSCANGVLKMATSDARVPGLGMVKRLGDVTYLFAQSARRSSAGITLNFSLTGAAGKTATVVYDSAARYDPAHSSLGKSVALNSAAAFKDSFGAPGDDYQVKIYQIR